MTYCLPMEVSSETRTVNCVIELNRDGIPHIECCNCGYEDDYDGDLDLVNFCTECGLRFKKEDELWLGY